MLRAKLMLRKVALAALVAAAFILRATSALAQCALCRTSVENSEGASSAATAFNFAVLLLLTPPVVIFCVVFFLAYKHRDAFRGDSHRDTARTNLL